VSVCGEEVEQHEGHDEERGDEKREPTGAAQHPVVADSFSTAWHVRTSVPMRPGQVGPCGNPAEAILWTLDPGRYLVQTRTGRGTRRSFP